MSRLFYHVAQDTAGNLLLGVQGTMRIAGTGTNATIYGDEALTVILPNPMTNHASFGSFKCFLGAGDYDFYMAKAGYTFETLTGVQGHGTMADQNANAVAITGGSVAGLASLGVTGPSTLGLVGVGAPPEPGGVYVLTVRNGHTLIGAGFGLAIAIDPPAYVLHCNGSAGTPGGAWVNSTSLAALKQGIRDVESPLELLRRLRPRLWEWADDQQDLATLMPGTQAGFVVEEVQEVKPEWTPQDTTGTPGLAMRGLEAYLVAAVRELAQQVEALTARLDGAGR